MDYLPEVKTVCDFLAVVESSVSNREQMQHILCILEPEYSMFCTVLQMLPTLPTLHELKAKLFHHDA